MEHWTYTLSINGLHFPTNLSKAVALSSDRNDYCQIIIPTTIDDDDENQNKNNFANDDYINSTSQSDDDSLCTKIGKTKLHEVCVNLQRNLFKLGFNAYIFEFFNI